MTKLSPIFAQLLLTASLWGLDVPPEAEQPEAPAALFDQKIGDVGIKLEADGTWTTRLAGGWGQGFSPLGTLPSLGFPGYEKGGVFTQQPDFSLTLRLLQRYYLEVIYGGSLEDRSFVLGYEGEGDEFLQWAKVGNVAFSVPSRAGQTLAEGRKGAPAAAAALVSGPVNFELLGRYEDGSREVKTFRGYRDTQASKVAIDGWVDGRFFELPAAAGPLTGIRVLSQGEILQEASSAEVVIDGSEIRLSSVASHKYLVTWDGAAGWSPTSTPLLGLDPAAPINTLSGFPGTWYVLVNPGTPSPFAQRNRYPIAKGTTEPVLLVDDDGREVSGYSITQSPALDWFVVSGPAEAPFYGDQPGIYPSQTAPRPPPATKVLAWSFRLPSAAATSYSLGTGIIASSVVVVRNGSPTTAYRFDASSGNLQFNSPVYDVDLVEISYQRSATTNKASDLMLWQAGRWDIAPKQGLEWALQGRWNMEKNRFTTDDLQSPGRVGLSLSYEGSSGPWSWKASATGGALLSDSTGHRRLYGMADSGAQATLNGASLRPSSLPVITGFSLTEGRRAPLVFRNYWSYDPLTGSPQVSAWGTPGVDPEPLQTDGWIGPYLVRGDGERDDRLAVMEATLDSNEWTGMQIYLDQGKPRDLRSASAVSMTIRVPQKLTGAKLYFQAGSLSDDWDGTGIVRKIQYRTLPSLEFYDQVLGRQFFPVPEGSSWGNDAGDGSAGSDGTLMTRELEGETDPATPFDPTSSAWQTVRFQLTDVERQRLQRTTGWRLVLIQTTGTAVTQTILTGPVVFEGSTWSVADDPSAALTSFVSAVEQVSPDDKDRQQLRIDWKDRTSWAVQGRNSPLRPSAYGSLAFRYKLVGTTSGTTKLTLRFGDAIDGLTAQWDAIETSEWVDGLIDLRAKTLTVNGIAVGAVSSSGRSDAWDRLTITQDGPVNGKGTLYLSQIEAADPIWEPVASSQLAASWRQAEAWPPQWPIFSGFSFTAASQQSGLSPDDWAWRGTTALAGSVGPVKASGEAAFLQTDTLQQGHGAYETTLPLGWQNGPRLEWTEQFSDYGLRSERVVFGSPWLGTWTGQVTAKGPPAALDQEYKLGWTAAVPDLPAWTASLGTRWSQFSPRDIPLTGFASLWNESWSWLAPLTAAPFYLLEDQAAAQGVLGPLSMEFKTQNHVSQSVGQEVDWTAWGDWGLRFPYHPAEGWTITPAAAKSAESVYKADPLTPRESAYRATALLWTGSGLAAPPFAERFYTPWTGTNLKAAKYTSSAGVDWERPVSSDWTDLLLPASAGAQFSSQRGVSGLTEFSAQEASTHWEAKGLNLFGNLGSTPLFHWYRTDVLAWAASGRWSEGTRAEDNAADASVTTRADLILTPEESISLPITYQGSWGASAGHTLGTKPGWSLRGPADLPFELPRWISPSSFRRQWVQTLNLSLNMGWQPQPAPLVRDLQIAWKGSLLMSEKSALSLTTKWGQQWQTDLWVVGLEASLDLILNF